jgi:hypothetical protein
MAASLSLHLTLQDSPVLDQQSVEFKSTVASKNDTSVRDASPGTCGVCNGLHHVDGYRTKG